MKEEKHLEHRTCPPLKEMGTGVFPCYSFYKKPMASKLGILSRSAVPETMKVNTACNELRRR